MGAFVALFVVCVLFISVASAHPPVDISHDSDEFKNLVRPAVASYRNLTTHVLRPFQETKVKTVLTAKKQNVNGVNVFLSMVVEEDMVFMGPGRGWPSFELHRTRMFTPIGDGTHFTISEDHVPPKNQIIDPTGDHASEVEAIKAITVANLNSQLDDLDLSNRHQRYDTFLRADFQVLSIENYAMNQTSGKIDRVDDTHVKLTNMVFLSRDRSDTGDEKENLGVSAIATDVNGHRHVVHVWSSVLNAVDDDGKAHLSYEELQKELKKVTSQRDGVKIRYDDCKKAQQDNGNSGGVSTLDWVLVIMLMSIVVGMICYNVAKLKSKGPKPSNIYDSTPTNTVSEFRDNNNGGGGVFRDNDVELSNVSKGLDMRPMDGAVVEKFDSVAL